MQGKQPEALFFYGFWEAKDEVQVTVILLNADGPRVLFFFNSWLFAVSGQCTSRVTWHMV